MSDTKRKVSKGKYYKDNPATKKARDDRRPRHPETNQRELYWLTTRAKWYYGGMPDDRKTNTRWKECQAMANEDAKSIAWVYPNAKITGLTSEPKPTAEIIQLASCVRNDGLPKGIVTASEKKARRVEREITFTPEGWIYALKDHMKKPGYLKLGKSNDLDRRLRDFNTAGDFEMMYWREVQNAKDAEDMVHGHLREQHYLREWYSVSLKDATEAMDIVADVINDPDWEGIVDVGDYADES